MHNDVSSYLRNFMNEMKCWELDICAAQDTVGDVDEGYESLEELFREKLHHILDNYSTPEGMNRMRLIDLGSTIPVTYDPDRDIISVEERSNSIFVVAQAAGFKSKFRFSLVARGEGWVIAKKERLSADRKWVGSSL